jgi:manganese transport protein
MALEMYGYRRLEAVIIGFVAGIAGCYAFELFLAHVDRKSVAFHTVVPQISSKSIYVAVGMLGATVMPHVVYLHSSLVQARVREDDQRSITSRWILRARHARYELLDVLTAMNVAWLINSAMIIMAASVFFRAGRAVETIEQAHRTLDPLLGPSSSAVFALALLLSGLSSSTVGTMAGQVIIEGFLQIRFSIMLRRLITMIPALIVIAFQLDPLKILVLSQVALSFALPFALVPLIVLTRNHEVMSDLVNTRTTNLLAYISTAVIIALNLLLIAQALGLSF